MRDIEKFCAKARHCTSYNITGLYTVYRVANLSLQLTVNNNYYY